MEIKHWKQMAVATLLTASLSLPAASALSTAQVTADALYMRATPGGEIITTLPHGTVVTVQDNSDTWFKVTYRGREGYVSSEYLKDASGGAIDPEGVQEDALEDLPEEPVPTASSPAEAADVGLGQAHVVCSTLLNMREEPNTNSRILAEMSNGTLVNTTGMKDGWYQITYDDKIGYVHPDYIKFDVVLTSNGDTKGQLDDAAVTPSSYEELSETRKSVLDYAAQFLGVPYVYGGSTPDGFDCSGFTSYVFEHTVCTIPRIAQSQYDAYAYISRDELLPGDLVFFGSSAYSISHVGIYVGDDQFIHAPHTGDVVKYDSLSDEGTYGRRFQGGGRVIDD